VGLFVQRYYDPGVGRFLSVDPVGASSINGGNFNRYWYADNNPYRFIDPDGREACGKDTTCRISSGASAGTINGTIASADGKTFSSDGKIVATAEQRAMVRVASDGHSTPDAAATQFGQDTQAAAKQSKKEPQAGIVKTGADKYGYTSPMWGGSGQTVVNVATYVDALIAVYGANALAFAHGHYDNNMLFSPIDVLGRGGATIYMHNQNGQTRKLTDSIERQEIRRARARNLSEYLRIHQGMYGECVGGC
jgi:sortase (surface protein transpeptidase)